MSNTPITDLPVIVGLLSSAEVPAVQGGVTGRTTAGAVASLGSPAGLSAAFVVLSTDPLLTAARILTASSNVTLTDAGAGSTVTVDLSATGVVAGSYTSADVTVDAKGRVTFIANGAGGTVTSVTGGAGITITGTASTPVVSIANSGVSAATYGSATKAPQIALNAQGQATSATEVTITPAVGSITGLGTGVGAALAINVGSAGAPVLFNGALGTPSSGTASNLTGLPLATGVTGTLPIGNGGTGATTAAAALVALGAATSVATLAALKALTTRPALVTMDGYTSAGDGGGGDFWWDAGSSTTADDGTVVQCTSGAAGRYKRIYSGHVNVRWFGAVGDGATDDAAAINAAAVAAQSPNGGVALVPPSGAAYVINSTVTLPNGVKLLGAGTFRFPGATAVNSQWTQEGSWLQPTHASNPGVTLGGHGSEIDGINFIYNQTPPAGSFTPTQYGYAIRVETSHTFVNNIRIVNGWNGIEFAYTSGSGGGTNVWMRDVIVSAFNTRLRTSCVNDTMYWSDIHCRNLWYSSDADVIDYIRANTLGWQCGYTDNLMVDGIEFFEDNGIFFEDETCLGNTHSMYNAMLTNVQFNLCQKSMVADSGDPTIHAYFGLATAQQGNAFGLTWADTVFDLASDNIDISFSDLTVVDAGGIVFNIGGGAGGIISCGRLDIRNYSSVSAAQTGIAMAAASRFDAGNVVNFFKNGSAGVRVGGAGSEFFSTAKYQSWQIFSTFFQLTASGTGSYADVSTGLLSRPGIGRYYQSRIVGNVNVTIAFAATTMSFKISGIPQCEVTGIPTAATGFQDFDTGWVDITEAQLAAVSTVGRLQHNTDAAVTWQSGEITVLFR